MDKKKKNSLNVLLIFILIGITCVYFYFNFDLREIAEGIAKANFPVLCIGFFAALIYCTCDTEAVRHKDSGPSRTALCGDRFLLFGSHSVGNRRSAPCHISYDA